jgi:hypothetical protein
MKSRWLLNVGLALLLGALVLLAIYRPTGKPETPGTLLTALAPEAVQRIRLLRAKQPEIVLEKSADRWRLVAPRDARANGFRINELARLVSTPVAAHFPATGDLGQYGLSRPLATLFLNDIEIRFGSLHPLASQVYVLHAGEVKLLPAATLRAASVPLDDLHDTSLLGDPVKLTALRFPGFSLKQNELGAWVRSPEMKELSSDRINRFVDEWRHARALAVAPASTQPVRERITVTLRDGEQARDVEFGVLARRPELVLRRLDEKLDYHFPEDAGARLLDLRPDPEPSPAPAAVPPARN